MTKLLGYDKNPDGSLSFQFWKEPRPSEPVPERPFHRTLLTPDADITETMARVNAHLTEMGCEPVSAADIAAVEAQAAKAWKVQ